MLELNYYNPLTNVEQQHALLHFVTISKSNVILQM